MGYTRDEICNAILKLDIDISNELYDINDIVVGVEVEMEHGTISPETNITNDNLVMTLKIALAHLNEFPDYYVRLKKMEEEADAYWQYKSKKKNKVKYLLNINKVA